MTTPLLYDVPGPRARRRALVASLAGLVVLLLLLLVAAQRLRANGQFAYALYEPFVTEPQVYQRLADGLRNTLTAAAYALVMASVLGVVLACGRLSHRASVRVPATVVVEVFRGLPLLLVIFAIFLAFPLAFGIELSALQALVLGLTLYNGAVIAEIVRAGVLAIPRGQTEAAMAVGLGRGQVLRLVLLPQAVRIMLPSLISQLVVLLKDTSLGFIIGFSELLRTGGELVQVLNNPIQMYVAVALIFIAINGSLSLLASYLEGRQRRSGGTVVGAMAIETGMGQSGAPV